MTLNEFMHESHKILDELKAEQPGTDDYQALLRDYSALCIVALNCIDVRERLSFEEENNETPTAPMNIVQLKTAETEPTPEPAPATEPDPEYTYDDVQSALIGAARGGFPYDEINAMIASTGYEKLSDIPANLYPAILQWIDEKKAGAR